MNSNHPQYPGMCAGQGKYFSLTGADSYPQMEAYHTLNWHQIIWYAYNPLSVPKEEAWWVIPSTLHNRGARLKQDQLRAGAFHLLTADIDEGNLDLATVVEGAREVLDPGTEFVVYASRSSTDTNKKWRLSSPTGSAVPPEYFHHLANMFNTALGVVLQVKVDPVTERVNQVIYVGNEGEHYEFYVEPGVPWGDTLDQTLCLKLRDLAVNRANADPVRKGAVKRAKERGHKLKLFNEQHPVEDLLEEFGFIKSTGGGRDGKTHWHHPSQTSDGYSTSVKPDGTWLTASETVKQLLGRSGGDAFDLLVAVKADGDFNHAYKVWCDQLRKRSGLKIGTFTCNGETVEVK